MSYQVGIYRGSFDPPHLGHLETVNCALKHGIDKLFITFIDANANKPERSGDEIRLLLLQKLFENRVEVSISLKSFKITLIELLNDPSINKIRLIIGSDLLQTKFKPMPHPERLSCLIIPRSQCPLKEIPLLWNGLPTAAIDPNTLVDRNTSSTDMRLSLAQNKLAIANRTLTTPLLEMILSEGWYSSPLKGEADKLIPAADKPFSFELNSQGLSKDLVFFVKDKHGESRLVVKVFTNQTSFESEVAGYNTMSTLQLRYVKIPKIYYAHNNVMIMKFAPGKPLAELMSRDLEAVKLCAKGNAELHLACTSKAVIPPSLYETIFERIVKRSPEAGEKLRARWDELTKAFVQNPGLHSLTHGDPNHFNWLVDMKSNTVTYIDLPKFSDHGFGMQEFYEAQLCFWTAAKRIGGVDKKHLKQIRATYKEAYFESGIESIATDEGQAFFEAYWNLHIIDSLLSAGKSADNEVSQFLNIK